MYTVLLEDVKIAQTDSNLAAHLTYKELLRLFKTNVKIMKNLSELKFDYIEILNPK
jgi:hypothetical protein